MPSSVVCVLGMGIVFIALICIVFMCNIMSFCVRLFEGKKTNEVPATAVSAPAPAAAPIANKQEIIAAACAVIAEEIGADAKNLRVVSFKRM